MEFSFESHEWLQWNHCRFRRVGERSSRLLPWKRGHDSGRRLISMYIVYTFTYVKRVNIHSWYCMIMCDNIYIHDLYVRFWRHRIVYLYDKHVWYGKLCMYLETFFVSYLCLFHPKDKVPSSKTHRRKRDTAEAMILDEEFRRGETLESDAWANKKTPKDLLRKTGENDRTCTKEKGRGGSSRTKNRFFLVLFWMFFSPTVLFGVSITIITNVFLIFSINYQLLLEGG